jgi:hypothetical protein
MGKLSERPPKKVNRIDRSKDLNDVENLLEKPSE